MPLVIGMRCPYRLSEIFPLHPAKMEIHPARFQNCVLLIIGFRLNSVYLFFGMGVKQAPESAVIPAHTEYDNPRTRVAYRRSQSLFAAGSWKEITRFFPENHVRRINTGEN